MRMKTQRCSLLLAAISIAALSASTALALEPALTVPQDREAKIQVNVMKLRLSGMIPSAGMAPANDPHPHAMASGTLGQAPSVFDAAGLTRFLQTGLQESYNKTYQDGWNILHTVVQNALGAGSLPQGVELALTSGRDASYSRSYQAAYEVLHECLKEVSASPGDFAADPSTALAAYFRLAIQSGYNKTYQDGWGILEKYISNLTSKAPGLLFTPTLALCCDATLQSSYSRSYEPAYAVLHTGLSHLVSAPTGDIKAYYFQTALDCASDKSYQDGWGILKIFIEKALGSGQLSQFDALSLKTTLQASYNKPYESAWEVLRDGIKAILK